MRVIAGTAGGIRLDVPKRDVRPTMDRVKAAIFSSLGDAVIGAHVLDLFAGTGALGIEALSRGAASARFRRSRSRERLQRSKLILPGQNSRAALRNAMSSSFFGGLFQAKHSTSSLPIRPYERTSGGESFTELLLGNDGLAEMTKALGTFVLEKAPSEKTPRIGARGALRVRRNTARPKCCFCNALHEFFFSITFCFRSGCCFSSRAYLVKMTRRGNYRANFGQRIGLYGRKVRARLADKRVTWIHAVSVGEVAIALKLAARLKELDADLFCVLTTTTTTGFSFAQRNAPSWIEVMYNPIDFWPVIRRAFAVIRPVQIILVEAEVWPNLASRSSQAGHPARVSKRAFVARDPRDVFAGSDFLSRRFFADLISSAFPKQEDVPRWRRLGVDESHIAVTGSIKYDTEEQESDDSSARKFLNAVGIDAGRPVLLGGSTHAGEEEILVRIFLALRQEFPNLFLVIAPRHVERVRALRAGTGKAVVRRGRAQRSSGSAL